ncbi:hypothetical protein Hypma_012948 [Hypsizygus marmoreus]|uniref:Protein YOP1 n=1 Tax=Hypsizygus marmoreus TaxID=39966 RepID=A0A369JCU8_HYPMA|nr:hypothetical protein Hypma_012948 [Hypsizygus marmoreus]
MPLVVPILRLVMLFFNMYESYKTLKTPPPSTRNGGRPSQRALTQRKRDMKGCLAVWIVWCCFITYERMVEALVSIFIPFYDELKSLALLFLILTRARGAEPIFLHIIRPLLKPYTPTLDMLLDLFCMVGDILFVIVSLPIHFVVMWWRNSVFYSDEVLDSETEAPEERPTTPTYASIAVLEVTAVATRESLPLQFPRKVSSDKRQSDQNGRPSGKRSREPSETKHSAQEDDIGSRLHLNGIPSDQRVHEVWYPPPTSYSDTEEEQPSGLPRSDPPDEIDEWRRYPAFPSAYPPTPIVPSLSTLPTTTHTNSTYYQETRNTLVLSCIGEDMPQQDFKGSLLPPRKPLNPGFVGGSSDEFSITGVQNNYLNGMSVDSDSADADEEDEFNITLGTPLAPAHLTTSYLGASVPLKREVSKASSAASQSTALTTAGGGSSLRTQSSSDSLSSGAVSISDFSSVLGRKRPLPLDSTVDVKARVRIVERASNTATSRTLSGAKAPLRYRNTSRTRMSTRLKTTQSHSDTVEEEEDTASISSSTRGDDDSVSDRKPAYPKRRKVLMTPSRVVNPTRPVRPRVTRYASVPKRTQQAKLSIPSTAPSRSSTRLHGRLNERPTNSALPLTEASQSSSSSVNGLGQAPIGPKVQRKARVATKAK